MGGEIVSYWPSPTATLIAQRLIDELEIKLNAAPKFYVLHLFRGAQGANHSEGMDYTQWQATIHTQYEFMCPDAMTFGSSMPAKEIAKAKDLEWEIDPLDPRVINLLGE